MEDKPAIQLISETPDTVTLSRATFDALLAELEDAEDSIAICEYQLAKAGGTQ